MRLLDKEHQLILSLMEKQGLINQFTLVKRKGWVHIEVGERAFVFHRKKVTQLVNDKFEDHMQYFVRLGGVSEPLEDFEAFAMKLSEWMEARET